MTIEDFRVMIPPQTEILKIVPVLDWLSINFKDPNAKVPEAETKDDVIKITDTISLKYFGKGNEHYKFIWHLLYNGEHLVNILSHTRNEKFVKKNMVKVEFKNHLLYTSDLWKVYDDVITTFELQYKNISRVDIAIDGLNYLVRFVNNYTKQSAENKVVELKGRGKFKSNLLHRKSMYYNSFQLGSLKKKQVTIYNKSQEIVHSQKDYIQRFWLKNGIARELIPLKELAKVLSAKKDNDDIYHIEGYENIYRFELRLTGEMITEIKDFSIAWLRVPDKLMSIVKRLNENFFHFVDHRRTDNSKCPDIDLLPYNQFSIEPITLQRVECRTDLYKTKLSIKKNVHQLYLGNLTPDNYVATEMLIFDVHNYDLKEWFSNKLPEWHKEYSKVGNDKEYIEQVYCFLCDLNSRFQSGTDVDLLI